MGLFGRKKEKKQEQGIVREPPVRTDKITRYVSDNGVLDYTFFDVAKDTSTSIKVNPDPYIIDNKIVYEMTIEWYGDETDTYYEFTQSHNAYAPPEKIYVGLDLQELQNDDNYFKYVMTHFLGEDRVNRYLEMSKRTEQEINNEVARTGNQRLYPCGKYVGSIVKTDEGYRKKFYEDVGRYFHNLPEMVKERNEYRAAREAYKQAEIAKAKARIESLEQDDWGYR